MSEAVPDISSPVPSRMHRWLMAVLLATLLTCGGAYWWLSRLTPDEQLFVGRWRTHLRSSGDTTPPLEFHELKSNRMAYSNGGRFQWAASEGQLSIQHFRPFYQQVLEKLGILPGSGDNETYRIGRYEVIDKNKIIMTCPAGSFVVDYEWTRIGEN